MATLDLTDVKEIQMEEVDVAGTIAFTAGVLLVLAGLMALYVASTGQLIFRISEVKNFYT